MQAYNNGSGSMQELQNSLTYQRHLFNTSRKQGATFEELKKIHLRIKELEKQVELLRKRVPINITGPISFTSIKN